MNSELLKLRCLSEDTRKALILEDEMEENFKKSLRKSQETLELWEEESKAFEELRRKLLYYFQEIAPSENLILPEEAAPQQRVSEKTAISFGVQTSFSYHTDITESSEYEDTQNFSKNVTSNTTIYQSNSMQSNINTLNNTSLLFRGNHVLTKTMPFDNLISPLLILSKPDSEMTDTYNSVFDSLRTPSVLDTFNGFPINKQIQNDNHSAINRREIIIHKDTSQDIVGSSGSIDNDNAPLVSYDVTTVDSKTLVPYDDTLENITDKGVVDRTDFSEWTCIANSSQIYDKTTEDLTIENPKLVEYDITKANLVDYNLTKTPLINSDGITPVSKGLVDYDKTALSKSPLSCGKSSVPGGALEEYESSQVDMSLSSVSEGLSTNETPISVTQSLIDSDGITPVSKGLVDYDKTALSKSPLSYGKSSVPGGALVEYESSQVDMSLSSVSEGLSTNETPISVTQSLIDSDVTPSVISDTPYGKSTLMKSQHEDKSTLKRSLASSIDDISTFENPNDTGINKSDLRRLALGVSKKSMKQTSSLVTEPKKQTSIVAEDTTEQSESIVEMESTSTSPVHAKFEKSESVIADSVDFNVHSYKEQSLLITATNNIAEIQSTGSESPRKRAADYPEQVFVEESPSTKVIIRSRIDSVNKNETDNVAKDATFEMESIHNEESSGKKSEIQDENKISVLKGDMILTNVSFASPVVVKKKALFRRPVAGKKRKRQPIGMPKTIAKSKLADSEYTFISYTKARAYQNSSSNRALRQLQNTTKTTLLSSAKKINAKKHKNKTRVKKCQYNTSTVTKPPQGKLSVNKVGDNTVVPSLYPSFGGTANCTLECSSCTAEMNSPPPQSTDGSTPLSKLLCKNCICALNARDKTLFNATTFHKKSLLTTILVNNAQNQLPEIDGPQIPASSMSEIVSTSQFSKLEKMQQGKEKGNLTIINSSPIQTRSTLRKRKAANGSDQTKIISSSEKVSEGNLTMKKSTDKVSEKVNVEQTVKNNTTQNNPQYHSIAKNKMKETSKTVTKHSPLNSTTRKRSKKNSSASLSFSKPLKQKQSENSTISIPLSPLLKKKSRASGNVKLATNTRKSIHASLSFQKQLSVLREVNENSVTHDHENQPSSHDIVVVDETSKTRRRPGLRKRKIERVENNADSDSSVSVMKKTAQEATVENKNSNKENTAKNNKRKPRKFYKGPSQKKKKNTRVKKKPVENTLTDKVTKQKAASSKPSSTASRRNTQKKEIGEQLNNTEKTKSRHETQINQTKTNTTSPSTKQPEKKSATTSSESDDNEVILNLPNGFEDFNSKIRKSARTAKKTKDSGDLMTENDKENNVAVNADTSHNSDCNDTVIKYIERTPKNRGLRILGPRKSNVDFVSDNGNARTVLPQPFVGQLKKNTKNTFGKPLEAQTTTTTTKNNERLKNEAKTLIGGRNQTVLDGMQSSNNSTMMNRSRKLFKAKSNSMRTPESEDKSHPMNSTVLDHRRQSMNPGNRGSVIPDVSAIQNASRATTRHGSFRQTYPNISFGCPPVIAHLANRIQGK